MDTREMRSAQLVKEFGSLQVRAWCTDKPMTSEEHKRLGDVVTELRNRSLLD